ncbi:DUF166 family protein [[Eubacterium] cellulosolvens]
MLRIYIIYRGPFGEQIINNIALRGLADQIVNVYELTPEIIEKEHESETDIWSKIWEDPQKYIPQNLPIAECDLLLVLGIHSQLGDLIPPIAEMLGAKAVLYPIDDRDMAPEAKKTIQDELNTKKIDVEFPEPFCILDKSENEYINQFAKNFGRPKVEAKLDEKNQTIQDLIVIRDSPSGAAASVAKKLIGLSCKNKEMLLRKLYEEHQNDENENCCMAEMDPLCPLMQEAADLFKDAIFEACKLPTTKKIIIKKLRASKGMKAKELEDILVDGPGNWTNPDKACDSARTLHLYIDELKKEGRIIESENLLKA